MFAKLDLEILECAAMTPVADEDWIPCLVPISTRRTVDEYRAGDPVRVLEGVVTVVPGMTVLSRLEVVCKSVFSSNGTLRNTVDPIRCVCMKLSEAMPVDCGSVVRKIISDMNSLGETLVSWLFQDHEFLPN